MKKKIEPRGLVLPLILLLAVALIYYWYNWRGRGEEAEEPAETVEEQREVLPGEIRLTYLGHSAFLLETSSKRILMDPYAPEVGYGELSLEVDIVTVSHEHLDHNYAGAGQGNPEILRGLSPGTLQWQEVDYSTEDGIRIYTVGSYHDQEKGRYRGRNAIFVVEAEEMRIVHLGDLGHLLEEDQVEELTPVDILLLPVGGHYTIGPSEASQVVEQLEPRAVIPMHYRTEKTEAWPIKELNNFLSGQSGMKYAGRKAVTIKKDKLPEIREIWPLAP